MKVENLFAVAFSSLCSASLFGATQFQSALDCADLSFATGGDASWIVVSDEAHAGSSALRSGSVEDSRKSWVESSVYGFGMLSFWWKVSSESGCDCLEVSVDGSFVQKISGSGDWRLCNVIVSGDRTHTVRWCYSKDWSVSSGSDCGWLDQVEWTPAPDSITVTYVTNGGDALGDDVFTVSGLDRWPTVEDLQVPERAGYEFCGWCLDPSLTRLLHTDEELPLASTAVLYAKWGLPVSRMDGDGISFRNDGDTMWSVSDQASPSGGLVAEADGDAVLTATVIGYGTLSFQWRHVRNGEGGGYYYGPGELSWEVDGDPMWPWAVSLDRWFDESIVVLGDEEHDICWVYYGADYGDVRFQAQLCDIVWTPAPELMTVTFDTDGGTAEPPLAFYPGDSWNGLPVPQKTGFQFGGWYVGTLDGVKAEEGALVPFQSEITLVAKWTRSVSYMHDSGLSFSSSGTDRFLLTNILSPDGRQTAEAVVTRDRDASYESDSEYKVPSLTAKVVGPAFLAFKWRCKAPDDGRGGWVEGRFYIDGTQVEYIEGRSGRWSTEKLFVPKGTHTLKWVADGAVYYEYQDVWNEEKEEWEYRRIRQGEYPSLAIGDIRLENYGPQSSLDAWVDKYKSYDVFVTGDAARFKKAYTTRISKNPNDYEARIFRAVSTLAELAENSTFKSFAKEFGFSLDYLHCTFKGAGKLSSTSPAVNTMVDKALSIAAPVMKSALADLDAIPDDWSGAVEMSADRWPVDETVYLDIADVRFARASLEAAISTLYYLGGYDLTVDWAKLKKEISWRSPAVKVKAIPAVDDEIGWSRIRACHAECDSAYNGFDSGLIQTRSVVCGSKVALLMEFVDGRTPAADIHSVYAALYSGNLEYDLEYNDGASWAWDDDGDRYYRSTGKPEWYAHNWDADRDYRLSGSVTTSGSRILFVFNCSKIPDFTKRTWSVQEGGEMEYGFDDEYDGRRYVYSRWEREGTVYDLTQKVIIEQTKFFSKVRSQSRLNTAKSWFAKALDEALAADASVLERPDDGRMHFVEYNPEDAEMCAVARENTAKALASLTDAQEFDIPAACSALNAASDFDFTLLPDNGVMRVCLGALFDGKITRAKKPQTRLGGNGNLLADLAGVPDPTFGGLFPGLSRPDLVPLSEAVVEGREAPILDRPLVPGEKFSLDLSRFAGYAITTALPKGWSWSSSTGTLTGTAGSTMVLTFKGGGMSERVTLTAGPKPQVSVAVAEGDAGDGVKAVTGGGAYLANATVKLVAAMRPGYAFGGWYDADGKLVNSGAVFSFKMPMTNVSYVVRSVSLYDDYFWLDHGWEDWGEDVYLAVGEKLSEEDGAYFQYESLSPCTISASGLPTGVKLARNSEGRYVLKGAPTRKGVYYAKISGKNNGGFRGTSNVKFLVGGARESFTNTAGVDLSGFRNCDPFTGYDFEYFTPVPAKNKLGAAKSVKVSGLPAGYKYKYPVQDVVGYEKDAYGENDYSRPIYGKGVRIYGIAATPGWYTITVAVTCTNGKVAKSRRKVCVEDSGSVYIPAWIEPGSEGRGTVSGGGVKAYGSTVKLTAKSKNSKSYFFAGWLVGSRYLDEETDAWRFDAYEWFYGDWKPAVFSFKLTLDYDYEGADIVGRFVTKAEDQIGISGSGEWRVEANSRYAFDVTSQSKPTVKASGLPAGTKLSGFELSVASVAKLQPGNYTVTLTATNTAGNKATHKVAVVVPNITEAVDAGVIVGLDTSDGGYEFESGYAARHSLYEDLGVGVAEGWTLSVSGLPSGWTYNARTGVIGGTALVAKKVTVTFTATKGKTSKKATATFNMTGLPSWSVGTYVGSTLTYDPRKTCPDYEEGVMTMTVAATGKISGSYAVGGAKTAFSGSGFTWAYDGLSATVKGKVDGKSKSFKVVIAEDGTATFGGKISTGEAIASELLVRNPWTRPDAASQILPSFSEGVTCSFDWVGFIGGHEQPGIVTLSFGDRGSVRAVWRTSRGSTSASAQIADLTYSGGKWTGYLVVGIPPNSTKKIAGVYCYVRFTLTADPWDGLIYEVNIADEYDQDWAQTWSFGYAPFSSDY